MKKKFKNIIYIVFMISLLIVPFVNVNAKTLNDMYKELENLKNQKRIADNNKKMTEQEIKNVEKSIYNNSVAIENTRNEVKKANEDIEKSTEDIKNKKNETKELLKFLQKSNGENVYLEYIMEADSYTELIYRYSVVNQISSYNNKVMTDLKELIKKLEKSKVDLAEKEKKLQNQISELSSKKISLGSKLVGFTEGVTSVEEDIKILQDEINYYKNTLGCSLYQDINSCVSIAYASSFRYPLVSGRVSSLYGGRSLGDFHYGQDYGVAEGTKVYASAAGKVAYIRYKSTCGGNQVYIYHNVKGKPYTTMYLHLLSVNVSVGQTVTSETVIGLSGGGDTTTSPNPIYCPWKKTGKGYDKCSCGAHLHFQLVDGHRVAGASNYTINPKEIFPSLTHIGASWNRR